MIVQSSVAPRFTRSPDGILAGVCKGLAEAFDVNVTLVRLAWVLAFFLAGVGGIFYVALALALPRKDKLDKLKEDKILGVCARLSEKMNVEIGLVRLVALASLCLSLGATVIAYIALYFVLPLEKSKKNINIAL